jgi:predicted phage-related endonuclease
MIIAGRPWLVPVWLDPETNRTEWLLSRLGGIGGSDAAAIVDEHPYKSKIDVWSERVTGVLDEVEFERATVGRMFEPTILNWYSVGAPQWPRDGSPYRIVKPPTVYHRDRPWHRGSADGLVYLPEVIAHLAEGVDLLAHAPAGALDHIVEVKTHGWFMGKGYGGLRTRLSGDVPYLSSDGAPPEIPADKRIQCAWYMALYDAPACRLIALIDTHLRRTYEIPRDLELEATLLEHVERFWMRHVLTGEPPPADGSPSYKRFLAQRFKTHSAELVPTTPEVDAAIRQHIEIKRARRELAKLEEQAEQNIKAHIGGALGVRTTLGNVTWKNQRSGKLHEKAARAELYSVTGWTDDEIASFERRHAIPDFRALHTPNPK